jgi:DNA invertase Pin-like site-specific DNA recombinase
MTQHGNGKHPGGRPQRSVDLDRARELLASGLSLRKTAATMRLGYGTLHRAIRDGGRPSKVIQNPGKGMI